MNSLLKRIFMWTSLSKWEFPTHKEVYTLSVQVSMDGDSLLVRMCMYTGLSSLAFPYHADVYIKWIIMHTTHVQIQIFAE